MTNRIPTKIIDAEVAKIESKLADSLHILIETYDGLKLGDDDCLHGGDEYSFLRLSCDQEAPLPDMLPSISHGDTIFFLVPSRIDWPRHLRRHIFAWLPRGILDEGSIFIPDEDQDLLYATGIDSAGLIETLEDYWCFVAEVTQVREDIKVDTYPRPEYI